METIVISFSILVTVAGFSFMAWTRRASHRKTLETLRQIDTNSSRIANHTRHSANLVVQNGQALAESSQALARVEPLAQQILTRLADEKAAH
jgi:hypothetical protein